MRRAVYKRYQKVSAAVMTEKKKKKLNKTSEEKKRWSQHVTKTSNALDLEPGVFAKDDPKEIAISLKRSAEQSSRRKSAPFRSAMSMLNFYINRAGRNLPERQKLKLRAAKEELRKLFGKSAA